MKIESMRFVVMSILRNAFNTTLCNVFTYFFKKINKFNLYTNIKEKKIQLQWLCAPANKILTNVIFIFEKYVQFIIMYLLFF